MKRCIIILLFLIGSSKIAYSQPDLAIVGPVTVTAPNPVHVGITINITFSVQNKGTNTAIGPTYTGIYLAGTLLSSPILVTKISLEALQPNASSNNIQVNFPIPYSIVTSGSYNVVVQLNEDFVPESDFTNNTATASINIDQNPWAAQNLPYPIIFIHGYNSDSSAWNNIIDSLKNFYGWSYGGNMDFCLNADGNLHTSDINTDYHDFTGETGHALNPNPCDFYTVNFAVNPNGIAPYNSAFESNQSAIVKQGKAVQDAIKHVLAVTGKDKVILVCHSMGGLAAREYLQNLAFFQSSDLKKHVAKLLTLGTPHGGTDIVANDLYAIWPVFDGQSEAIRDLRTGYYYSYAWPLHDPNPDYDAPGVFLFGGIEDLNYMRDEFNLKFYNPDVNCDGNVAGQAIGGINHVAIPLDLSYSCIVGSGDLLPINGDGVVTEKSANINNFLPVNADIFTIPEDRSFYSPTDPLHVELTNKFSAIMRGIDEPNNFASGHPYKISSGQLYYGLITTQSNNNPQRDYDKYSINLPSNGSLNIQVSNITAPYFSINVYNVSYASVFSIDSHGKSYLNVNVPLPSGYYYIDLSGIPTATSYLYPYAFKCTFNPVTTSCNSLTTLTASSGTFDDGSGNSNYNNNSDCKWLIQPSGATSITLSFTNFDVSNPGDTVFVYDGSTITSPILGKFTGNTLPTNVTSTGGSMLVRFVTDATITAQGWTANYTAVTVPTYCNGTTNLTSATGTFSDGSSINDYGNNSHCSWLINPPGAFSITLNFSTFNTEPVNDVVNVYDGIDNTAPLLGSFSGTSIPPQLTSTGGAMFVQFITNSSITAPGWNASYTSYIPYSNSGIIAYEYWFDTSYSNVVSTPIMPQNQFELNTNIPTTGLSDGLHSLNIRFEDNNNLWSSVLSNFFYKSSILISKIVEYQYWFDNDFSSNVSANTDSSQNFSLIANIANTGIAPGLHTFHIRFKDYYGKWSSVTSDFFFKSISDSANKIVKYRYWFDNLDSSITNVSLTTPLNPLQLIQNICAINLSNGSHEIHFQFKDSLQLWSSVTSDTFNKVSPTLPVITASSPTTFCQGDSVTLTSSSGNSYLWNSGDTTQSVLVKSAGIYTVTLNNGSNCSLTSNPDTIIVNVLPNQPGPISGIDSVCQSSTQLYTINPEAGATSYTWTLPAGWVGSSITNSIAATIGNSGGTISVTANNSCGSSSTKTLSITVNPTPTQPGTVSGNNSVCQGSSQTYFVTAVIGATSYTWTLPAGWTGSSTTNSITATVGNSGGTISVTANNSCGSSSNQTLSITVNQVPAQPGGITGSNTICKDSMQTYSVSPVTNATSYTWTLPVGWTGSSTTSSIQATAGNSGGIISVKANNSCGNSADQSFAISVNQVPSQPGLISGSVSVSIGQNIGYTVNQVNGATGYNWVLTGGGNIISGQNTNLITINWLTQGTYTLTVSAANSCGNSIVQSISIIVSVATAINNVNNTFEINIVPNPSPGQFYLTAKNVSYKDVSIVISDIPGQIIYIKQVKARTNDFTYMIDLSNVANGIYNVRITIGEKTYSWKIAKID